MNRDLLDLVRELNMLNDDNLADRVIENSDVQWCLSELQDILEEAPTLTPPNEALTCEGCKFEYEATDEAMCEQCIRSPAYRDYYCRPPEGEEDT